MQHRTSQPQARLKGRLGSIRMCCLAALIGCLLASSMAPQPAEAQVFDIVFRIISKIDPSFSRNLSNKAKGEIGEGNIKYGIRQLANNADAFLELETRFLHRSALSHGIDAIYFTAKRTRFHVVEAKATQDTGRISLSLLNQLNSGVRQMDDVWIRRNLDRLYQEATRIAGDQTATQAWQGSARRAVKAVEEMRKRQFRTVEKTMVVTRLQGVDPKHLNLSRNLYDSVDQNVFSVVNHVVEVDRNGKVLAVYVNGMPRAH